MDGSQLVAALRDAAAYDHPVGTTGVELIETHISWLFFAGERVYKVKKPLDLAFLDYTTLERRRHFCEEEVRLNRRLAPKVYLGVVPIGRAGGALRVGREPAEEYAVVMLRLPAERMLAALLARGEVDNSTMNALADLLAQFHAAAATGPGVDEHGSPRAVAFNVLENFEQTLAFVATQGQRAPAGIVGLSRKVHGFLETRARSFLDGHRALLERRVREGRIRDGHGDLHAGNICFAPEGLVAYDCIEFAPRLRCGDVACDLAFLAMDLDLRGFRGFSGYLVRRYAERVDDAGLLELIPFYKAYRAMVRAKVGCLRAQGASGEERAAARLEAMRYLNLAASYALRAALILTCGLPASGKSWAARAVATALGAALHASDVERKLLHGVPLRKHRHEPYGTGLYSSEAKERTYAMLLEQAQRELEHGRSTVIDATFDGPTRRAPFLELARRRGTLVLVIWSQASEDLTRQRLAARARDESRVSDADLEVYLQARTMFEAPAAGAGGELAPGELLVHGSGTGAEEDLAAEVLERLLGLGAAR